MSVIADFLDVLISLAIFVGIIMGLTAAYKWFNKNYLNKNK